MAEKRFTAYSKPGVTDYNVIETPPFQQDIERELGETSRREGLGVYCLQAFDRSAPDVESKSAIKAAVQLT